MVNIILCVPKKSDNNSTFEDKVKIFSQYRGIDLIVYPEKYYEGINLEKVEGVVKNLAEKMGVAVLAGIETTEGYQTAAFWNPSPKIGDTQEHLYFKHSTAKKLAYHYQKYMGKDDKMFNPIILNGEKIGVLICHDMFFPLIPFRLKQNGAEMFINLTGGNVNFRKWSNIIKGRSLELQGPFLCTMAYDSDNPNRKLKSSCIAYQNGSKIIFTKEDDTQSFEGPEPNSFALVKIPCDNTETEDDGPPKKDNSKDSKIQKISVSFLRKTSADLDIRIQNGKIEVFNKGKSIVTDIDDWIKLKIKSDVVGLTVLPMNSIFDPLVVLKRKPKDKIDHYFIIYWAKKSEFSNSDIFKLAKLRAIENRIGIFLIFKDKYFILKTTDAKDIQWFEERNGCYDINLRNLGGPETIFKQSNKKQGIPLEFKDKYLELLP